MIAFKVQISSTIEYYFKSTGAAKNANCNLQNRKKRFSFIIFFNMSINMLVYQN